MDNQLKMFGDLHVVEFGKQDEITVGTRRRTPFDLHRLDWVPWGTDNLHPDKFLAYYSTNSTYEAVIRKNAQLVRGDRVIFEGATPAAERGFESFLDEHDPNGDVLARSARDIAMFNAAALYVVPSTSGGIASVTPIDFANLRSGVVSMETHKVECMYYCPDWGVIDSLGKVSGRNIRGEWRKYYKPVKYPLHGYEKGREPYLLVVMALPPAGKYYPNPVGTAAQNEIELVYRNIELQLKQLQNGMFTQMHVTIPYVSNNDGSQEDLQRRRQIVQHFKDQFTGSQQAGTAFVELVNPSQLENGAVTKIEKLDTDMQDKRYTETNRLLEQSIMTNLGVVAPELYGLTRGSGFSSEADKLEMAMRLQIDAAKPQQRLIARLLKKLANAAGYEIADCTIETDMPNIRDMQAVGIEDANNEQDTPTPQEDGD